MGRARSAQTWHLIAATPPREVFAVMEQMMGTPPFQFRVTGDASAEIVEFERKGFFGQWKRKKIRRLRWVTCSVLVGKSGSDVTITASRGLGAEPRALQLVQLLSRGNRDQRTVYRRRLFPSGAPVSLVASWAGMLYPLYTAPQYGSPRGVEIHTATPMFAVEMDGTFLKVQLPDGVTGYVEADQVVAAPARATREAQPEMAAATFNSGR